MQNILHTVTSGDGGGGGRDAAWFSDTSILLFCYNKLAFIPKLKAEAQKSRINIFTHTAN